MSAKTKRIERSQRFKRAWRGENRKKAVSPVVATLILILIAVAAAAALYLWLVAWQGGVTGGIGNPSAQYTVSIGGSTSVYPFAEIAATQFEQNNSDVVVSVNQGGSGAGMAAVCSGQVNIGEASAYYTPSVLETQYGCPSTVVTEVIAYDGVDVIVPSGNFHGVQSMSWDTLQAIYVNDNQESTGFAGLSGSNLCLSDGTTAAGEIGLYTGGTECSFNLGTELVGLVDATSAPLTWAEIPAAVNGASFSVGGVTYTQALAMGVGVGGAAGTGVLANDVICAGAGTPFACTGPTPCGYMLCAGGTAAHPAADTIQTWSRSDVSGTEQSFGARLLAVGASGTTPLGVGFTGCSGDNQLDGCGISTAKAADGNPAVITGVGGSADAIGFASDGLAQAAGSGVVPVNFEGYEQTIAVNMQGESTALAAIASGISAYSASSWSATAASYIGWRPFLNVETTPPTGEALRYLQFVMDPANNENFAAQSAEISVYASGLAGHVPVTPIP
jgi:flagellin-like protein